MPRGPLLVDVGVAHGDDDGVDGYVHHDDVEDLEPDVDGRDGHDVEAAGAHSCGQMFSRGGRREPLSGGGGGVGGVMEMGDGRRKVYTPRAWKRPSRARDPGGMLSMTGLPRLSSSKAAQSMELSSTSMKSSHQVGRAGNRLV